MRLSRIATMLALTTAVAACLETGAAGTSDVLAGNSDPRLEQKISFSTDGSRVLEVLAKLSESTGVGMIAGADDNDWMVYDRKVIIHVADIKLIELMRALSSVLRFEWSRTGEEGKWAYQLQQSKEQHAEEQSLRAAADDAQARQFREKRENVIADLVNLSS
ncbi:MAG: hypothetical protein ACPL7K_08020, partial [Armatimonadota bacterium]